MIGAGCAPGGQMDHRNSRIDTSQRSTDLPGKGRASMKRMACVVALAAGTGVAGLTALPAFANPSPATAVQGLQVNIVPPGTVSGDTTIPLEVKFHGGNIRVIELFIDGSRVTRQALS